jgi:hypothetical protein
LLLRLCSCAKHSPTLSLRATTIFSSRRFLLLIRQETSHKHEQLSLRRGERNELTNSIEVMLEAPSQVHFRCALAPAVTPSPPARHTLKNLVRPDSCDGHIQIVTCDDS